MAEPLHDAAVAADAVVVWTASRNDAIRSARQAGASLRVIAEATGLSHGTVDNICRR